MSAETRRVEDVVRSFENKDLQVPDYQREYCWSEKKAKHFLDRTKNLGHVLGVITSYRLDSGTAEFLQDGLQRVTTLHRAIDKPSRYDLTQEDKKLLQQARVSYQQMVYETHDQARQDFQHLNDGVGLSPYEKYRGDLEKDEDGQKLYSQVREITSELTARMSGESKSGKAQRKLAGQSNRCSLGLFYMYASSHKDKQVYAVSEACVNAQIERRTRDWLEENLLTWETTLSSYVRALERVNAILSDKISGYMLKKWDTSAIRGFYAAYFHCMNIGCTTDNFTKLVEWYVDQNISRKKWQSRFEIVCDGVPQAIRIDQTNLKWLDRIGRLGGPAFAKNKREKRIDAPAGYDESHIIPHADGGTEVFVEPSILNRSRGRLPVIEMVVTP